MILDEKNRKNLVFLILQFFDEEGYEESLHLYGWFWFLFLNSLILSFAYT